MNVFAQEFAAVDVDADKVNRLAEAFAGIVRQHYLDNPLSRDSVFEVLNALAGLAAIVIAGTAPAETESRAFFTAALDSQIVTDRVKGLHS